MRCANGLIDCMFTFKKGGFGVSLFYAQLGKWISSHVSTLLFQKNKKRGWFFQVFLIKSNSF